jgi:sugar/nucleoside kinase (ribokinase family)
MRNAGPPRDTAAILRAGAHVTAPAGRCLITLGEYGSLLVCPDDGLVHHQSAPAIKPGSVTVRAGDVLAGCLLAARLAGANWEAALQEATARTASYLRSRGFARARPYAPLLSPPAEIEKGNSISGDEKLRFLAALDCR